MSALASPQMEGRKAGTEGANIAASYILQEFRNSGIYAPDSIQQVFLHYADTVVLDTIIRRNKMRIRQHSNQVLTQSLNVIGYIRGSKYPDECVIISAQYDHLGKGKNNVFFGADDNASGTAALLCIAEAFAKGSAGGNPPLRTMLFIGFGAEETGLIGSEYYAERPLFPLMKTSAMLNMDMIGRSSKGNSKSRQRFDIYIIGSDRMTSDWKPILKEAQEQNELLFSKTILSRQDTESLFLRSDQYHFARRGVPVLLLTGGLHSDYHTPSDVESKIDYVALSKRTEFIFSILWRIANQEDMLERNRRSGAF